MKRTYRFVKSTGSVPYALNSKVTVALPIFPGILKHPSVGELPGLLAKPAVARKYTIQALRKAPWQVLRDFPPELLESLMDEAHLRPGREAALRFLLAG